MLPRGVLGALVEITGVSLAEPLPGVLLGRHVDVPTADRRLDAHAIDVIGWALGRDEDVVAIEFRIDGRLFWRTPVREPRPDLVEGFPGVPAAGSAGFRTTFNLLGTGPDVTLELHAVLADQSRADLATINARHLWRASSAPGFSELVSVVIPCFGQGQYLGEAIESVLAQSYPHLEIVVVDDGSEDNTAQVAQRYPGVRCLPQANTGLSGARNAGIRSTNGDFLLFLDADDRLLPDAVATNLSYLRDRPECAFVSGWYRRIGAEGEQVGGPPYPAPQGDLFEELLRSNWGGTPATTLYRRAVFEHVRRFNTDRVGTEDYELNLRIAGRFPVCSHGAVVAEYRTHGASLSANPARMLPDVLAALRAQRQSLGGDKAQLAAYREGKRFWREYYGEPLVDQIRSSAAERSFGRALRDTTTLLRHYPRGVLKLSSPRRVPVTR